jgi:hypothetical protein
MSSYQSVTTEDNTTYAQGCYIWSDWVTNFSSLIHGSHGMNLQKPATVSLFTHPCLHNSSNRPRILLFNVICILRCVLHIIWSLHDHYMQWSLSFKHKKPLNVEFVPYTSEAVCLHHQALVWWMVEPSIFIPVVCCQSWISVLVTGCSTPRAYYG